jgi:hypothetical protein
MPISAQPTTFFVDFGRVRALRLIFAAAVLAAMTGAPATADARSVRSAAAYDGTWNVVFTTLAGNCSSSNSVPFAVSRGRVSSAGGGKVTGGISPAGIVSVRISLGLSAASGSGRLAGRQLRCGPLERDHLRRPVQRQLAGHARLIAPMVVVPALSRDP